MNPVSENKSGVETCGRRGGFLALSPLLMFLVVYLGSSLAVGDFYRVPVSAAFLVASVYALLIGKGRDLDKKIGVFSAGAGNRNVLMMIWIFVLAGAFANTARQMGAVESTVNLALMLLPGTLILAGLFVAACLISMSIGTSVGTIVALVPIAAGIASQAGIGLPLVTACIV